MSKLNKAPKGTKKAATGMAPMPRITPGGTGPLKTKKVPTTHTYEGGTAYVPKAKTELFQLAVTNMVGEKTFYESADTRDARFTALVHKVAVKDPAWMLGFLGFLRGTANMRTASVVAAAEAVKARLDAGVGTVRPGAKVIELEADPVTSRKLIDAALQRADEPGELLAYWLANHGRNVPKPVKRGLADAAARLYNEYTLLKYDTASHGVRFGDVLDLVHPTAGTPEQGALFKYALDRRHGRDTEIPTALDMVKSNHIFRTFVAAGNTKLLTNADSLKAAGMTWEDALSLAGSKVDKAKLWEAMIPSMGIMALIRNLRNFDEAGVSDKAAKLVIDRLTDPAQIAKSRQFPMRFLSAYRAAPSLRWGYALEQAITLSLANVPQLNGRTLIMVDTSSSMNGVFSKDGTLKRWDAAVIFGVALAQRCASAEVVSFSSMQSFWNDPKGAKTKVFGLTRGESLLKSVERWKSGGWNLGGGTDTAGALRKHYAGHDRVVVLTDEQAGVDLVGVDKSIPATVPMFTWNLAGYRAASTPSGQYRHTFGGLTDAAFKIIPLLELGESPDWDALFNAS